MIFSRVLRDSMTRYVGPSVGRSVGWLVALSYFGVFRLLFVAAPAHMLRLAFFITAPAPLPRTRLW